MNTLRIEAKLAEKYKYKPLPNDLSAKYRQFFTENIPPHLDISYSRIPGGKNPLFTINGSMVCTDYDRIVVGDYGAFVEFSPHYEGTNFIIAPGQEYRVYDERYSKNVKYIWLTIDDGSGIKIYKQKKRVAYADYLPEKYYVSVHEVY